MASLFLVSRLWDAVNDPIIGSFPDRWRIGKSGDKFTPWIKLFMIPLALSGVFCFDANENILPERFTLIAIIFGICSLISYMILCTFTKERVPQYRHDYDHNNRSDSIHDRNLPVVFYIHGDGSLQLCEEW